MNKILSSIALIGLISGCGGETVDPPVTPAEVQTIDDAGAVKTFTHTEALEAGGDIERIGTTADGHLLAVVDGQLHELDGGLLRLRALFVGEGDPSALGTVHAVAPRTDGGAWVGAEAGLFSLDPESGIYTYKVPLLEEAGTVWSIADRTAGPLTGLWLGADDGLHRMTDTELVRYSVDATNGPVKQVAITHDGSAGLALIGETLVTLEPELGQILTDRPPLTTGTIHALAASNSRLYVGAENGLFELDLGRDVPWTHYTLGGKSVLAVSVDAPTGSVWARTADSLIRVNGAIDTFATPATPTMGLLAVDNFGDVWTADGSALGRNSMGGTTEGATFAEDLTPWIAENCSQCHKNQTQNFEDYEVFKEVAESALSRVRSGDMPRCDGGLRCPSEQRLQEAEYSVLEQWIRDGMPE